MPIMNDSRLTSALVIFPPSLASLLYNYRFILRNSVKNPAIFMPSPLPPSDIVYGSETLLPFIKQRRENVGPIFANGMVLTRIHFVEPELVRQVRCLLPHYELSKGDTDLIILFARALSVRRVRCAILSHE